MDLEGSAFDFVCRRIGEQRVLDLVATGKAGNGGAAVECGLDVLDLSPGVADEGCFAPAQARAEREAARPRRSAGQQAGRRNLLELEA